jgi:hypothetical protein
MSSRMKGFEADTLRNVMDSKRVGLVHAVGNALLMIAFFYWTRIPEENGWQFSLTVVGGAAIGFATLWLHCATFSFFRPTSERSFRVSLRESVARIPAFFVWTVVFGCVLWMIGQLWNYDEQAGGYGRHLLPLFLRRAITPRSMFSAWHWLVWILYFLVWPILFLPVGGQVAVKGFRGFFGRAAFRPTREVRFWIVFLICFLVGAYVPYTLVWMVPRKPSSLTAQTWSMVLRLGFAYLLLVTTWVVLCAAIMRASDDEQPVVREPDPASILKDASPTA